MNEAQLDRRDRLAARAVGYALVPNTRLQDDAIVDQHAHMLSRITTFQILLDDEIDALITCRNRQRALALVLVADFCWQMLREVGGRKGDDGSWFKTQLPQDHRQSDQDIGDGFFARQAEIVEDAKWLYDLHSALRHPGPTFAEYVWLLKDPIAEEHVARLLRAARGIQALLLSVAARVPVR
jgi:hypothetical protein